MFQPVYYIFSGGRLSRSTANLKTQCTVCTPPTWTSGQQQFSQENCADQDHSSWSIGEFLVVVVDAQIDNLLVDQRPTVVFRKLWWVWQNVLVQALVDHVQLSGRGASDVKPPITGQSCLGEDGPVRAEEWSLAAVEVAVMPHLERWKLRNV